MSGVFDRRVDVARADAVGKRSKVLETIAEVRQRLSPRTIITETTEDALAGFTRLLGDATAGARSRPWLLAAGATLVGIVISLRAHLAAGEERSSTAREAEATKADIKS